MPVFFSLCFILFLFVWVFFLSISIKSSKNYHYLWGSRWMRNGMGWGILGILVMLRWHLLYKDYKSQQHCWLNTLLDYNKFKILWIFVSYKEILEKNENKCMFCMVESIKGGVRTFKFFMWKHFWALFSEGILKTIPLTEWLLHIRKKYLSTFWFTHDQYRDTCHTCHQIWHLMLRSLEVPQC